MRRNTFVVTERHKLSADLLVVHLLEKLMKEQVINQATYMKAKSEVVKNVGK